MRNFEEYRKAYNTKLITYKPIDVWLRNVMKLEQYFSYNLN